MRGLDSKSNDDIYNPQSQSGLRRDSANLRLHSFKSTLAYRLAFVILSQDRYSISSAAILGLVPSLGYLAASYLDGTLVLPGADNIGLLEDPPFLSWFAIVFMVIVLIRGFYTRLEGFFEDFVAVIDSRKYRLVDYESQVRWVDSCIGGQGRFGVGRWLCYSLGLGAAALVSFGVLFPPPATAANVWGDVSRHIAVFVVGIPISFFYWGYLVPTAVWHLLSATWGVWKVVGTVSDAGALILRPIAPDQAGGLRPLGSLSLAMVYTVLSPMIWIALTILVFGGRIGVGPLILVAVYLALVVVVFFLPLGSAHEAMKEAKEEELTVIAEHFNSEYDKLMVALKAENQQRDPLAEDAILRLERLQRLYEKANDMPVWPFDTRTLLRFGTTIGIPIALTTLNVALGRFS